MREMTAPKTDLETEWLRRGGLKPTRQRLALATSLIGDGRNRHVTAESLHEAVQARGDSVSLATVYNTLNAFRDAGLMQEVAVDGSKSIFCTKTNDHPHFFWEDEGRLTDAPAEQLDFAALPKPPEGMEIAKIDVIIRLRKKPAISPENTHGAKRTDAN
jgi:Fur family iron response transcriptional regulator|tara:strand:- start:87 stop:563 length:477 start_codon:yes stop_codon:yes gene_type:complete